MSKETVCTGCGATVTQDCEGVLRDSSGYRYCPRPKGEWPSHAVEIPPVAIKPEARESAEELAEQIHEVFSSDAPHSQNIVVVSDLLRKWAVQA